MKSHQPKQMFPPGDVKKQHHRKQLYPKGWSKIRREFISRHPLCRNCELFGQIELAQEVDHIKPLAKGGDPSDEKNLQPLCRACHRRKTAQDNKYQPGRGRKMPPRKI